MKTVIDLDLHEAIEDFGVRSPAGTYEFKSQDTIDFQIYFVQGGIVQDMGSSFALKFGMIKTGDATDTILAYQTASSYLTDPAGLVYYQMQVVMNTSQMASAIGTASSIACTIEIRYQDALGEITHTLNIPATVFETILVETGVTPPGVSTGYPDSSTIELLVHKDEPSGYAGLNASSQLFGAQIPVDGQTIIINSGGQIASGSVLAYTAANFLTPAANATVAVTFGSTSNLHAGQYVRIPIAGYYSVTSITDSTHAVLTNIGDPLNASSGVTITSGAALLPAQAVSGGGGGTPGQNAYTQTTAAFTVPSIGSTVSVAVQNTAWLGGIGYYVFITGAGYYAVNSITDSTHVVLTNAGSPSNAIAGTNVPSASTVAAAGSPGAAGAAGAIGLPAYDALSASFVMPAASATVNITIANTGWTGLNQIIYIATGGYFQISAILSATQLTVTNLPYPGNAAPGTTIASGSKVSPGGLIGPQGAGGTGLNAFTTLSSNFVQPAVSSSVTIVVGTTAWMVAGEVVYIAGGGYYQIGSVTDTTHASVVNLGYAGNANPGATVTGSGTQGVSPGGLIGPAGAGAYTYVTAAFTMPAALQSVTISVANSASLQQNQNIYIASAGYFSVSSVLSGTQIIAINLGSPGNVTSGTTIPINSGITPAGATGPAINTSGGFSTAADAIAPAGTGEVSHIASQTGGVLALKKLKSGTTGSVALTDNGGTTGDILVDVPVDGTTVVVSGGRLTAPGGGGGAGGGGFNPMGTSGGVYVYEEFLWYSTGTGAIPPGWQTSIVGTGSVTHGNNYGNDSTRRTQGCQEVATGGATSGSNAASLLFADPTATFNGIQLGYGTLDIAARIAFEQASLPATGNGFVIRFGLWQCSTIGGPPIIIQGSVYDVFMEYSPDNNGGNLRLHYKNGSTAAYVNGSASISPNAYSWWEMKIDASGNITMLLNGTSIGTASAVAQLNQQMGVFFEIGKSGTTAATNWVAAIDALYISYPYSR